MEPCIQAERIMKIEVDADHTRKDVNEIKNEVVSIRPAIYKANLLWMGFMSIATVLLGIYLKGG